MAKTYAPVFTLLLLIAIVALLGSPSWEFWVGEGAILGATILLCRAAQRMRQRRREMASLRDWVNRGERP